METLVAALAATLSPDNSARKAAEAQLEAAQASPGFPSALLAALGAEHLPLHVHLASSLAFKRCALHSWHQNDPRLRAGGAGAAAAAGASHAPSSPYSDAEKAAVRDALITTAALPHLSRSAPVLNALSDAFRAVFRHDFPDRWPHMSQQLLGLLTSRDAQRTVVALRLLRMAFYNYGVVCPESGPLSPPDMLATQLMPTVQALAAVLADDRGGHNSLEAARALALALKCFRLLASYNLHKIDYACRPETVAAWADISDRLLRRQLPAPGQPGEPSGQPADPEARAAWPWWNCKKWAVRVLYSLLCLRSDQGDVDEEDGAGAGIPPQARAVRLRVPAVVQLVRKSLAPRLAETVLGLLIAAQQEQQTLLLAGTATVATMPTPHWLSPKVLLYSLKFMEQAVDFSSVWRPLRPHLPAFVAGVLVGVLRLSKADTDEFEGDPLAWVQQQDDVFRQFSDPRNAAVNLLHSLVVQRGKHVRPIIDALVSRTLTTYAALPTSSPLRDHAGKEAVLRVLGRLNRVWRSSRAHRAGLEPLLAAHVVPELASPIAIMRVRAIETLADFADSAAVSDACKRRALEGVLVCLRDSSPPVRFTASSALRAFLHGCPAVAREAVAPHVVGVISVLFSMLDDLGLDTVIDSINAMVLEFDDLLPELAPGLTAKLADVFNGLMRQVASLQIDEGGEDGGGGGDDDGMPGDNLELAVEALMMVLNSIVALLSQQGRLDVLQAGVLPHVWAVLAKVFDPEAETLEFITAGIELFERAVESLSAGAEAGAGAGEDEDDAAANLDDGGDPDPVLLACEPAWAVFARALRTLEAHAHDFAELLGPLAMNFLKSGGPGAGRLEAPSAAAAAAGQPDFAQLIADCAASIEAQADDGDRLMFVKCFIMPLLHFGRCSVDRVAPQLARLYARSSGHVRTVGSRKAVALALGMSLQYSAAGCLNAMVAVGSELDAEAAATAAATASAGGGTGVGAAAGAGTGAGGTGTGAGGVAVLSAFLDLCTDLAGMGTTSDNAEHEGVGAKGDEDGDDDEDDEDVSAGSAVECKVVALGVAGLLRAAAEAASARGAGDLGGLAVQLPRAVAVLLALLQREQRLLREHGEASAAGAGDDDDDGAVAGGAGATGGARGAHGAGFGRRARSSSEDEGEGVAEGAEPDEDGSIVDGGIGGPTSEIEDDDEDEAHGVTSPLDHVHTLLFADAALRALGASALAPGLQASLPPAVLGALAAALSTAAEARRGGAVAGELGVSPCFHCGLRGHGQASCQTVCSNCGVRGHGQGVCPVAGGGRFAARFAGSTCPHCQARGLPAAASHHDPDCCRYCPGAAALARNRAFWRHPPR